MAALYIRWTTWLLRNLIVIFIGIPELHSNFIPYSTFRNVAALYILGGLPSGLETLPTQHKLQMYLHYILGV